MSINSDDLYKRLGVEKTASDEDIKKAYKKAALKWHPDRNAHQKELATENFKKISEAYEILSDEKKKRIYDQCGMKGFTEGFEGADMPEMFNFGGGDMPNHQFRHQFKQFNFGQNFPFGNGSQGQKQGQKNHFTFNFSNPNDIFTTFFSSNMNMFEDDERGFFQSGHKQNKNQDPFSIFDNHEFFQSKAKNNNCAPRNIIHEARIDLEVLYNGGIKKFKISNNSREKIFEIDIKPGWKSGTKVSFEDKYIGNVTFIILEKEHQLYKRDYNNLIYKYNLEKNKNSSCLTLEMFSKKKLNINIRDKKKGEKILISGEGMPIRKDGKQIGYGDLIIELV
jgi:DnaJ family protein B protein 4